MSHLARAQTARGRINYFHCRDLGIKLSICALAALPYNYLSRQQNRHILGNLSNSFASFVYASIERPNLCMHGEKKKQETK